MSHLFSNCCGASPWHETDLCSDCFEHAEFEEEDTEVSQHDLDRQIASKLWILCKVPEFGLGAARREMMKSGFPNDQIQRVSQILLNFN